MIAITLNFVSIEAARAALLEIPLSALVLAPQPKAEVELPKPAKAEKAKPAPAPVPEPTPEPAPVSAPAVDYPTLQKAVFALAAKNREAAATVAGAFGVKTFKELPEAKWADALVAVQAALEAA